MLSTRIGTLVYLLWIAIPCAAFGQSSLDVSPGAIYRPPGNPSCYTISVGDAANMSVDLEFYFNSEGPYYTYGWPTLDGNGQAVACIDEYTGLGLYEFAGVRDSAYGGSFIPVYAALTIASPPPVIYSRGPGGDNWDAIWITGAQFHADSRVYVYSYDWSTYQIFWGPAWGYSPAASVAGDGTLITLQVTDPTVRNSFGNAGVHVLVVNDGWNPSAWTWTQSPPPSVSYGDAGCEDLYCIWMVGGFPLNASIDLRVHGQSEVLPNSYTDLTVTTPWLAFRVSPGVRYAYDTVGLDAWVVNPLFPNWSGGTYFAPKDRTVIGNIVGISVAGSQYFINGWACAKTYAGSISVEVVLGGGGTGAAVFSGTANLARESGTATECSSAGSNYRFSLAIPGTVIEQFGRESIYMRGISPYGLANLMIGNPGVFKIPGGPPMTLSWKQDYIRDGAGAVLAIAKPAPSNATQPSVPAGLNVTGTSATSVSLSWPASSAAGGAALTGYKIYRQLGSGANLPIGSVGPNATTVTFSDTTVQSGHTYTYTVVAVNAAEVYSAGTSVSATTP